MEEEENLPKYKCINFEECGNEVDDEDDLTEGMCEECYEVDDTPISDICDICQTNPATTNICGTDLCDDCLEDYHH